MGFFVYATCRTGIDIILNVRPEATSPSNMASAVFTQSTLIVYGPALYGRLLAAGVPRGNKLREFNERHEQRLGYPPC